jgi:hypothetical protein
MPEMTPTERLLAYLASAEGLELATGMQADIGGDPDEYGIDPDFGGLTHQTLGEAYRQGFETAATHGLLDAEFAGLIHSGDIDWPVVGERLDEIVMQSWAGS